MIAQKQHALAMILKGYPRISETFISNEIRLLEELGFHIHIFSMRQPRESFSHKSVKKISASVDYLPETIIKSLPHLLHPNLMLAVKRPGVYAGALKTALRRFARSRRPASIKHLLQAGYLVYHFLPGRSIVHLHAHFAHSPASVTFLASRLCGLPFSFTAHAKDIFTSDPAQLREKIEQAQFVVTCTEYNRRYLKKLSAKGKTPIHRSYHGIDTDFFSPHEPDEPDKAEPEKAESDKKEALPTEPYRVLTVARMTEKKGLPTVLKAIRCLRDQGIRVQHTLIGDGDIREEILRLIDTLDLGDVVRWLGTRPHDVVLGHYRHSDLFVLGCELASNGDRDGIPNVLLESMAMGVPVVATNISAIPELIQHEKTGLLVSPRQPEAMASAMMRLLTDRDLRKGIIAAAKDRVVRDFNNRRLILDLATLFEKCVNN